jgi:hypothetical protein
MSREIQVNFSFLADFAYVRFALKCFGANGTTTSRTVGFRPAFRIKEEGETEA